MHYIQHLYIDQLFFLYLPSGETSILSKPLGPNDVRKVLAICWAASI